MDSDARPLEGPCAADGIPLKPDANIEAMCRLLRTDDYKDVDALWTELSTSREFRAQRSGDPQEWLELGCSAAILAQTALDATQEHPGRSKGLRKYATQFSKHATVFLSQVTGDETAEAVSQVQSLVAELNARTDTRTD